MWALRPRRYWAGGSAHPKMATPPENCPFATAGFFSRVFYLWATPLFRLGFTRPLTLADIWSLRKQEQSATVAAKLESAWTAEQTARGPAARLSRAYRSAWWTWYIAPILWSCAWICFGCTSSAYLMRTLLVWFETQNHSATFILGIVLALTLSEICKSVCLGQMWYLSSIGGTQMQSATQTVVFDKLTRLRVTDANVGAVVTLMMNDALRVKEMGQFLSFLFLGPAAALTLVGVLLYVIGPAILSGFAVMLILIPTQRLVARAIGRNRRSVVPVTSARTTLMNEILNGVKLIKMYGWEGSFAEKISEIRRLETSRLLRAAYLFNLQGTLAWTGPTVIAFATFGTQAALAPLTASQAFTTLALLNMLRSALQAFPNGMRCLAEALVAMDRIQAFLQQQETDPKNCAVELPDDATHPSCVAFRKLLRDDGCPFPDEAINSAAIVAYDASFQWGGASLKDGQKAVSTPVVASPGKSPFTGLEGISLCVRPGELIGIIGVVGSGKSSLLSALLGHMVKSRGAFGVRGRISYATQNAWIFNDTLRNNVLFGATYDEARFQHAVASCAMESDIAQLPGREETEIGERGINLSGGQKARVSLARIVYDNADIAFLDDPLSAVDVHVGKHLWQHCIKGALAGKTRLLVTHQLQYLSDCDRVVVMDQGRILHIGTAAELTSAGVDLTGFVNRQEEDIGVSLVQITPSPADEGKQTDDSISATPAPSPPDDRLLGDASVTIAVDELVPTSRGAELVKYQKVKKAAQSELMIKGRLITNEFRVTGSVHKSTLMTYLDAAGGAAVGIGMFMLVLACVLMKMAPDWYLSKYWTKNVRAQELALAQQRAAIIAAGGDPSSVSSHIDQTPYVKVYAIMVGMLVVMRFTEGSLFAWLSRRASRTLHDLNFARVVNGTMAYFDTTPLGRILNRFSGDLDSIDTRLPESSENSMQFLSQCILSVVVVTIVFPWFLIPLGPIAALFIYTARYFRKCARELKRLEGMSRSPLLTNVQASAQGLSTIRAFGKISQYVDQNVRNVNGATAAFLAFYTANRWVAVRLDLVVSLIVLSAGVLCVMAGDNFSPSFAGLALAYTLQMGQIFQFATRQFSEAESTLTAVERLCAPVPQESELWKAPLVPVSEGGEGGGNTEEGDERGDAASLAVTETRVGPDWPAQGSVEFVNVCVRYRPRLPLVLNGVSFRIQPQHRVGVVGRTGSGKSTMGLCLFRMLELAGGSILIDGVDVGSVPLSVLRSRVSIIPQDPVLFTGTVRRNLDPFGEYDDAALWHVLEQVDLFRFVSHDKLKLEKVVEEGGVNFSCGQRQLLCVARALLRQCRVVLLDEATAAVDADTDATVQRTIRRSLRGCTLIIIAHRLHTIMDCHKILGFSSGRLCEYASPATLLQVSSCPPEEGDVIGPLPGLFHSLISETGPETARALRQMAVDAEAARRAAVTA